MQNSPDEKATVSFGPCCFCAKEIIENDVEPCRITVETVTGKWQVWACHAACFKEKLTDPPECPGLFEPAHF
jgi:hypothetical protein